MLAWQITNALSSLLIPPGLLLVLFASGLALIRRRPRAGRALLIAGAGGLYLLSMPLTGTTLLQYWESPAAGPADWPPAAAIVVLGGGQYRQAPEYGGDTAGAMGLVRLRYAAELHRRSSLPVLVSGGSPDGAATGEAQAMQKILEREFAVPVRWSENRSANTLDNARYSRDILAAENIRRIVLVTHAWHMPRARLAFEQAGFEVVAAPTAHATRGRLTILDFLPDAGALLDSALFFHEVIGTVWYRLRFIFQG
ncbi:MAG: YdcF family protein [Burkholderiales bacterium]|nr:YdcF family protein [Burkholderiales bacterium]